MAVQVRAVIVCAVCAIIMVWRTVGTIPLMFEDMAVHGTSVTTGLVHGGLRSAKFWGARVIWRSTRKRQRCRKEEQGLEEELKMGAEVAAEVGWQARCEWMRRWKATSADACLQANEGVELEVAIGSLREERETGKA